MGAIRRWFTRMSVRTIRSSLPNASDEKLVSHYHELTKTYRLTEDLEEQHEIVVLQVEIRDELARRGKGLSPY